jgi:hypothetical protein
MVRANVIITWRGAFNGRSVRRQIPSMFLYCRSIVVLLSSGLTLIRRGCAVWLVERALGGGDGDVVGGRRTTHAAFDQTASPVFVVSGVSTTIPPFMRCSLRDI